MIKNIRLMGLSMGKEKWLTHLGPITPHIKQYRSVGALAALIPFLFSIIAFFGWFGGFRFAVSLDNRPAAMTFNTALCFFLFAGGLLLRLKLPMQKKVHNVAGALTLLSGIIALVTVCQDLFSINLGIDQLVIADSFTQGDKTPGRMAMATSITLLILCASAVFIELKQYRLGQLFAFTSGAIGYLSLTAYVYNVDGLYQVLLFDTFSLNTIIATLGCSMGVLFLHPCQGLMRIISSNTSGGRSARLLGPIALLVPVCAGGLIANLVDGLGPEGYFAMSLFAVSVAAITAFIVYYSSSNLYNADIHKIKIVKSIFDAEKAYRGIFENAVEGMFRFDKDGTITTANQSFSELMSFTGPEALLKAGANFHQDFLGDADLFYELTAKAQKQTSISNYEITIQCENCPRTVLLCLRAEQDTISGERYFEGSCLDITELRSAEQQKNELEKKYIHAQKLEAIGQLAGGIAHDFNNYLVPIIGHAHLGLSEQNDKNDNGKFFEKFHQISSAAEKASKLVRQILAYSRKQVFQYEAINVARTIDDLKELMKPIVGDGIQIIIETKEELWPVKADRGQVEQVLLNLLTNAHDAMPSGGVVLIACENVKIDPQNKHLVEEAAAGEYVKISVTDTGHGIPADILNQVFEPFYTTKKHGTGLGLSTAYGIIKQHGGHIQVTSNADSGTQFDVYLPRSKSQRASQPETSPVNSIELTGEETILVIDDNQAVLQTITLSLATLGANILEASSPDQCLQIIREYNRPINLLITDLSMPGMSGKRLATLFLEENPAATVLFISGYDREESFEEGSLEPGDHFLSKPFRPHDLVAAVKRALASIKA